uniref:Translocation protein SEC62 n=1 Tax=Tetraselmis sp. GSL018 TaxID=582737 RepID=A0A061QPG5_9CHLO
MGRKGKFDDPKKDPFLELAQQLRTKNGIPWRTGVAEGDRVEYFRGKDFAVYFRENPEKLLRLPGIDGVRPGRTVDVQIEELYYQMARRHLMLRATRMHKKPKPGRKRLVKWPKKLLYEQDQRWEEEAFYCWTFDRPTSPWLWLGSALMALVVFMLCLFPLAPYSLKISVVYLCMGLMGLILLLLFVRAVVFAAVWILFGRHFWLLPNVTSDELGVVESFQPLYEFSVGEDGKELPTPHWASRIGVGIAVAATCYALVEYAPDKGTVKTGIGMAHDSLLDFLNLHDPGMKKIAESNTSGAVFNSSDGIINATENRTARDDAEWDDEEERAPFQEGESADEHEDDLASGDDADGAGAAEE